MSETDMTDHPELREAVERYKRGESLNAAAVNSLITPDRIDALLAERDALAKDAARYRWLRGDSCPDHSKRWTQWEVRCWHAPQWTDDLRGAALDDAIDAAMAGREG